MAADREHTPTTAVDQASSDPSYDPSYDPAGEVVELCRDLIRIDTSNYGDESGPGERKAAEYVATALDEVGIESELFELESGRTSLVAHWGGTPGGWSFRYGPMQDALEVPFRSDVVLSSGAPFAVDGPPQAAHRSSRPAAPSRRARGRTSPMCV
jgi:hypothetical protein